MPFKRITWNRSREGFTESHCGIYEICPMYWGGVKPDSYQLNWFNRPDKRMPTIGYFSTQRGAKEAASKHHFKRTTTRG